MALTYFEKRDKAENDFERYSVISEYYRDNPSRISENRDYIVDVARCAIDSSRFLFDCENALDEIIGNFGIRDIVESDKCFTAVFKK